MLKGALDHIGLRTILAALAFTVITFASILVHVFVGSGWSLALSLLCVASVLILLAIKKNELPHPYQNIRNQLLAAQSRSSEHPMLARYYDEGLRRTEKELGSILQGKFNFLVLQVPDMSVHAMELVDKKCILTFPVEQSEAFLTPDSGTAYRYYSAMVAASKRMQKSNRRGVVRVFILKKSEEISVRLLAFIQKNIDDGIDVRLIFEDDLPPRPIGLEGIDFGYYENTQGKKWVMLLHRAEGQDRPDIIDYVVDTDADRAQIYLDYSKELIRKSKTFDEFMQLVVEPINGNLWPRYFAACGYEMFPPHGLSDEDADCIVKSALKKDPGTSSILVLGFTPKLIRRLIAAKVGTIVSRDQFESKPTEFGEAVEFETGNWLNGSFDRKFDAIIFDEAINNLSRLQLSLFFPQMAKHLAPHGALVGRVMGRFDDEVLKKYAHASSGDAVEMLRKLKVERTTHDDFAPLIICLLHSRNIAFSTSSSLVDCDRWNTAFALLRKQGYITEQEFRDWRLQFNFKLLSPDQDTLFKDAKAGSFSLREVIPVQGAYIGKCEDTAGFYRVFNFELVSTRDA